MSCCGGLLRGTIQPASKASAASGAHATLGIEYTGVSALSVIGPATGRGYHFAQRGCRLDVSVRDAPGLLAIASLRARSGRS
jgi:hypothetical protein